MAVSTAHGFNKSLSAYAQLGASFNKFENSATPSFSVGTRVCVGESEYVYSHFGAATNPGLLVSQDLSESAKVDSDNIIVAPASANTTTDGTVGSHFIEITLASVTADQYAGGHLVITDDTGEGYTYRIKGNTATGNPVTGNFRLELVEPLKVAVGATSDFSIIGSKYANLEGASATDAAVAGVSCTSMTAAYYGWIQVRGPVGVLTDGTVTLGSVVTLSDGVTGAVQTQDAYTEMPVGYVLDVGDDTGYSQINLYAL